MNESIAIDIKKYLQVVYARRYLCIAVSLICLSVIVWGSYFIPKQYEARSTVFVERNIINTLVRDIALTPSLEGRLRVISYTMTSRSLLLKVIDELDLVLDKNNRGEVESLVASLQKRTNVRLVNRGGRTTDWFSVTFRDKDPKVARDYVNTLVRRYVEENLSAKKDETYEANTFLTEQRIAFKEKLDSADQKITDFRRSKDIYIVVDEKTIVNEIKTSEENLETIKIQRTELEAKKSLTERQLKEEKPYTVAMLGRTKGDTLNNRIIMLQNKLNDLLVKYTENYPEVIRTKAEIEALRAQLMSKPVVIEEEPQGGETTEMTTLNPLHQKLKEELTSIDSDLAALSAKERRLRELIQTKKEYLRNVPSEKKILADLQRERDTYKRIDDELVLKIGQSEVSKQMELQDKTETFRIVDPAILPTRPSTPNRVMIILLGFIASIALGIVTVILLYHMDNSVKSIDELKKAMNKPVLAVIAQIVTEEEINRDKKLDRRVYAGSLAYLVIIAIDLIKEGVAQLL